ncbi:FAD-dependent oxidoreductase [Methylobacterium sp. SD274]|uniref:FAD-dependent oxidoreductase n=1 Tax=Methylobacterium sp. SD274 TaxID=2782009 RepID=UPI001A979ACF|nr:FAD-dependent oxidoreductase [Methylobacterium sp. SD274]MBO1021479.1 FAD-dependent oxidoreductase [Methylobacterium sp. SD274]
MTYFVWEPNSSGIVAACAAAKRGTDAILAGAGSVLGAMWAAGLGQTDRESTFKLLSTTSLRWGILIQFTREFAVRAGVEVNPNKEPPEVLFPTMEVVLAVFQDELAKYAEAKVVNGKRTGKITVVKNAPLQAVTKNRKGDTIMSVTCGGKTFECQNYTDCSDEGDLARLAGATMRIGRESSALVGEPTNGVRPVTANTALAYDPATGERWPDLDARPYQNIGDADARTMAFNQRIIVTDDANRIPWASHINNPTFAAFYKPSDYDNEFRIALEKLYGVIPGSISNAPLRPPGTYAQFDMNNGGLLQIGSNWIGKWLDWPYMTFAEREAYKNKYTLRTIGLFYDICTNPRWLTIPRTKKYDENGVLISDTQIVEVTKQWGLVPGLFPDSIIPGMSPAMYVRESFRIVGQEDMIWDDCVAPEQDIAEPITAYGYPHADAHWVMRVANDDGNVAFEGGSGLDNRQEIVATFMKWGAVKARVGEARNLTVVRCISGTKMGWITVRLEMCWMKIANAVGIAASVANDNDCFTGDLDYQTQLKPALLAEGAIISLPRAA